ncbi:MAG TPA: hypothetical protein VFV52_09695 [Bacilli bacterium]|nr:hypothetical protein [Bacilli bacterium]
MAKPRLQESAGTNLLISLLIRYPELSSLRYNPKTGEMSFTILITGEVLTAQQEEFRAFVARYFAACRELDRNFAELGRITHTMMEGVTMLVYEQHVDVLTIMEVRLFTQLVVEFYQAAVVGEMLGLHEEEMEAQEEIIEHLLGQKETLRQEASIVAYRDGGKVFVYNK